MSIIGDNIRALRQRENLTQQELADIAQVTRETVNKWESGTIEALREHNVKTLRDYFDLSLDDLRSESNGLAAKMRIEGNSGPKTIAVHRLETLEIIPDRRAYIASRLIHRHPGAFAVEMDDSMTRVLPEHCHAFVDPDLPASSGSLVLTEVREDSSQMFLVRRLHLGSSKAMLSTDSTESGPSDIIINRSDLTLRGTVFWYQAPCEME